MGVCTISKLIYKYSVPHFPASVLIKVSQSVATSLNEGTRLFFEIPIPEEGVTVFVISLEGSATVYASTGTRSPNSALHDFRIDDEGEMFVEKQNSHQRRQLIGEGSNSTLLFLSVEGNENGTNFYLSTSMGNATESIGECKFMEQKC